MGLWDKIRRRGAQPRADPTAVFVCGGDRAADLMPGYTPLSENADLRAAIHHIADLVSDMTLHLMENGTNGDRRIKNELSAMLDIAPYRWGTRKAFIYWIVTEMCLAGNAVVLPVFDGEYLRDLRPVPHGTYSFQALSDGYCVRMGTEVFQPDEILHFPYIPNRTYPWRGDGFAPLVRRAVASIAQAEKTRTSFLQSKWKPPLIISVNADINELSSEQGRSSILDSYVSDTEQGKPWVIPAGQIDIKTVNPLTVNDLAIMDGLKLDKLTVAAATGVPPYMLGVGTYNKEEYNGFIAKTVRSFAEVIQQVLSHQLITNRAWYVRFNQRSLMQYSMPELTDHVTKMVALGAQNRNEARDAFGYSPVDVDAMNAYTPLENYIPVDKLGDQKKLKEEDANGAN